MLIIDAIVLPPALRTFSCGEMSRFTSDVFNAYLFCGETRSHEGMPFSYVLLSFTLIVAALPRMVAAACLTSSLNCWLEATLAHSIINPSGFSSSVLVIVCSAAARCYLLMQVTES